MNIGELISEKGYNLHVSKAGNVFKNDVPVEETKSHHKAMCLEVTQTKQMNHKAQEEIRKAKGDSHPQFVFENGYFKYMPKKNKK